MELVNRETNFNKVFSAAPNVGVLNPLTAKVRILSLILHTETRTTKPLQQPLLRHRYLSSDHLQQGAGVPLPVPIEH